MIEHIKAVANCVDLMDKQLREFYGETHCKKLWENTYIKKAIDRRERGEVFTISDHLRAMEYSMLSSGVAWKRMEEGIDVKTGRIKPVDEIFYDFNPDKISQANADEFIERLAVDFPSPYGTRKQVEALIANKERLKEFEGEGGIDKVYKDINNKAKPESPKFLELVNKLSHDRDYKMKQLGEALAAEYLRNAGYDLPKPDRHIRRILGSKILACSSKEYASVEDVFKVVPQIAENLGKKCAEVDYVLWSYCATGYGQICTKINPKCENCVARDCCCSYRRREKS